MSTESIITTDQTRGGHALRLRLGALTVEAWYSRPPQSWKQFEGSINATVYDR